MKMETSSIFLIIFTFVFLQTFGASSNTMMTTSPNVTCIAGERESLLIFKRSLVDKLNRLSTWRGVECCEWHGVECDKRNNGHVVKLDLRNPLSLVDWYHNNSNVLGGEISPSLLNLKHLRYLDLSMNNFSGQKIPDFFGSFKHLKYLNLSRSGFGGVVPHNLGNLSCLQYLDLSMIDNDNEFMIAAVSSPFDDITLVADDLQWVSSLSSLKHLDLSGVSISHVDWFHPVNMLPSLLTLNIGFCSINSTIPSVSFVNFTSLNSLDLSFNQINSTIPLWLSNLTALMHLDISVNNFHGQVPDFLGTFSNLVYLDVSYNSLVGVLSEIHFTKLKNLTALSLSSNPLELYVSSQWITPFHLQQFRASSCNIGPRFPNWLQTQTNLQTLDLSYSSIRDTIPEWFENISFHISYLDLSHNQISGKMPPFQGSKLKRYLWMSSNKFEGSLASFPENVKVLDLSDNLLSGQVPHTDRKKNPSLEIVNLSNNSFTGSFPEHLCKVLSIKVLDLSQNNFSGRLPQCLGNLNSLLVIDLRNNTITGVVPSSLGSLNNLKSLHLGNNILHGHLPISLQNLTSLVTMDLGNNLLLGSIPLWIRKLSKLRYMNLQSNKFTGKIPLQLCHLNALQLLNLAQNNLTGTIPHCFGNLTGMIMNDHYEENIFAPMYEENILVSMKGHQLPYTSVLPYLILLDLSSNNLIGEIPYALMNLVALKSLNLSKNLLKGQIPMTIGNLKEIESLDLSMNKLSGRIPQSLATLYSISSLILSFNNLSGVIPVGNQIQTLDYLSIYEGNDGLCGPPLRSCKGYSLSFKHLDEDEGQDDTKDLWLCSGMGFVVGFVGLIGSLYFNRTWRLAYYGILGTVYNWLAVSLLLNLAQVKRKFV